MIELYVNVKKSEYFCKKCCQLRLSFTDDKSHCGNCGSTEIITGECGSLDKEELLRKWASQT